MKNNFAEIIRETRKKKGLSQLELSNHFCGYNNAVFNDLENEEFIPRKPGFIKKLADILDLDSDILFQSLGVIPDDVKKTLLQDPSYFKIVRSMWKKDK